MKKLLSLLLMLISSNSFAYLTQGDWRWRNDDGTETTATWKTAKNTNITMTSRNEVCRIRMLAYNNSTNSFNFSYELQYALDVVNGPWFTIGTTAGVNHFVLAPSAFVADNTPTTSQLGLAGYTFNPGRVLTTTSLMSAATPISNYFENEWAITATENALSGTTYYFRHNPMSSYDSYPSLTTPTVLPVQWVSFTTSRKNNSVELEWVTAAEQNNQRFDIMRSSDGLNWKAIRSMPGKGNTSNSSRYQFTDVAPLSGLNFYMIRQFDLDGKMSQTETRNVQMPNQAETLVQVFPNPTKSDIGFSILNKNAPNVEVTLLNAAGNIVHRQLFKNVTAHALNKLQLSKQPAAGMYILRLQAEGILETRSLIVR